MTTQFLLSEINAFLRKRDSWFSMQDLLDFISLEDEAFTRRRLSDLLIGGGLAYVIPFDRNGTEAWIGRNRFFFRKGISHSGFRFGKGRGNFYCRFAVFAFFKARKL